MHEYVFLDLLKVSSHTKNNEQALQHSLVTWGNHDGVKASVCPTNEKDPIVWFKKQYEESHLLQYDGVEHQPLFLIRQIELQKQDQPSQNVIDKIVQSQSGVSHDQNEPFFLLCLLQLDYFNNEDKSIIDKSLPELLQDIDSQVSYYHTKEWDSKLLDSQSFLNAGESDVAVLLQTNCMEAAIGAISHLRCVFPIVQSYTLIIFPYRYNDQNTIDSDGKEIIKEDFLKWFKRRNNTYYDVVTNFIIDNKYHALFKIQDSNIQKNLRVIIGDYDAQLITTPESLVDNGLTLFEREPMYRYSKTSPLIPAKEIGDIYDAVGRDYTKEEQEYNSTFAELTSAFDRVKLTVGKMNIPKKYDIISSLNNAEVTLASLNNYFIRLFETGYAPDVYLHIKPIFLEVAEALNALDRYCNNHKNSDYRFAAIIEVDTDIKHLMENLQQFLGIVSLSPHMFSESHRSYMRSANAGLKLICTYNAAVYLMHEVTKRPVDINAKSGLFERNKCAVLILPTRDATTINTSLFTSLTPEHHISIIEANFNTLFEVKKMLFQLAHEVGHFSGDRQRIQRQSWLVEASIRYMLYLYLFENIVCLPHYSICQNIIDDEDTNKGMQFIKDMDYIDSLNNKGVFSTDGDVDRCVGEIINIADSISDEIVSIIRKKQININVSSDSYKIRLKHGYLDALIDEAVHIVDNNANILIPNGKLIKSLSSSIVNLNRSVGHDILDSENIPNKLKWRIAARLIQETDENIIVNKITRLFRLTTSAGLYDSMSDMSMVFEDIYSDLYATKILNMSACEYAEYLLGNETDERAYANQVFMTRFYTVLNVGYGYDYKAIKKTIEDYAPADWKKIIIGHLDHITKYSAIFCEKAIEYAKKLSYSHLTNSSDVALVQAFYHNPLENLYELWITGMSRRKENL